MTTIWDEGIRQEQRVMWQRARDFGYDQAIAARLAGATTLDVDWAGLQLYPDSEFLRGAFAAGMHAGWAEASK